MVKEVYNFVIFRYISNKHKTEPNSSMSFLFVVQNAQTDVIS